MGFAPRDIFMLKVLGAAAGVLLVAYIGMVVWLQHTGFMSEGEHFGARAGIENRTPHHLTIEAFVDGNEWIVIPATVRPSSTASIVAGTWYGHDSRIGREGCTFVPLRAIRSSGAEVARRESPLCEGETWVIEDAP